MCRNVLLLSLVPYPIAEVTEWALDRELLQVMMWMPSRWGVD